MQEQWRELPFPSPGDLFNPDTEPTSLMFPVLAGRFITSSATRETNIHGMMPLGFPGGSEAKESARNVGDWVQSLSQKDPLEKEMATHSSIHA